MVTLLEGFPFYFLLKMSFNRNFFINQYFAVFVYFTQVEIWRKNYFQRHFVHIILSFELLRKSTQKVLCTLYSEYFVLWVQSTKYTVLWCFWVEYKSTKYKVLPTILQSTKVQDKSTAVQKYCTDFLHFWS